MRAPRFVLFVVPAFVLLAVTLTTSGPAMTLPLRDFSAPADGDPTTSVVLPAQSGTTTTTTTGGDVDLPRAEPASTTSAKRALYAYDDPIETRTSRCMDVPGFKPVDGSPSRSPLNVADYLLRETEGRTLTEIGSRNGDILACITHFKVNEEKLPAPVSVELDREYCDKMRARGIEV